MAISRKGLYLDTSVVSAYYDRRAEERRKATVKFWEEILPEYEVCISEAMVEEVGDTKDPGLKNKLASLIKDFKVLKVNVQIEDLAKAYVEEGIFPERYVDDAIHVACAAFYGIPYLISWNFEHLVKVKTRKMVNSVNILKGFMELEIISPQEL